MSRRSETWNAYESKLAGPLPSLSTSVAIESTAGLDDPAYLIVDPDIPTLREWIRVGTITPGLFENIVRNQEGSVGNIDHATGAVVRAVFTKQVQDDIFDDIEDTEDAVLAHVNTIQQPDPHTQYLLDSTAALLYVPFAGNPSNPMTGALHLRTSDPTDPEEATKKSYVDGQDHDHATPIAAHAAVVDAHHAKYTDGEAVSAMGAKSNSNPLNHDAVVVAGVYLPLTGGSLSGPLNLSGNKITNLGYPSINTDAASAQWVTDNFLDLDGGTLRGTLLVNPGTIGAPGLAFDSSPSAGFRLAGINDVRVVTAGADRAVFQNTATYMPPIYSSTQGGEANVVIDSSGRLWRSTSAARYKSNIEDASSLADLVLRPVTFTHEDGGDYIGFIADEIAAQDQRAAVLEGGEVESYDTHAVLAILAAKVNRLEANA